jgi:hypothetical protein
MNNRNDIQKELKELNSSLPLNKTPEIYSVPEGYFEGLAASVLLKIKAGQSTAQEEIAAISPVLAGISRKMPFSLPENYFDQTAEGLPGLIREDQLPDVLAQAVKSNPYQVPENYFNNLSDQVLSKVSTAPKPQAKLISMHPKRWMRYATAAVVTGVIALGSILYFSNNKSSPDPARQPQEWVAGKLKNVSNKELDEFIKTADAKDIAGTTQSRTAGNMEVRKLLKDVPDSDLDEFLNQVPGENDEMSAFN